RLSLYRPVAPPHPPSSPTRRSPDPGAPAVAAGDVTAGSTPSVRADPRDERNPALLCSPCRHVLLLGVEDPLGLLRILAGLAVEQDRKSTRLNSSHRTIAYAVFCLKK